MINSFDEYEKAKSKLRDNGSLHAERLKKALLEYRRQHNIYEIGDKIVSTLDGSEDWKNAICEILAFYKKMAITTGFSCAIHHYDYRHATDEEISAGHRIEQVNNNV